ncbi:MAG: NosD domain-containing protein, partial [Candidatus Thorarchaeota archaeon]|nr:NosD domain-containing protein [Candidatus Thorarchaeota archaeon]
ASQSDNCTITGNTIYDSEMSGLYANLCSFWTVFDNIIYDNGAPGIYLDSGVDNFTLYQNDIGWSREFLAYDAGEDNAWNYTDIGNWYSDYDLEGVYDIIGGLLLTIIPQTVFTVV